MRVSSLENYDFQELFLSKTNSILTANNALDIHASKTDDFLKRYIRFFNFAK
jgi:hypothetical protein